MQGQDGESVALIVAGMSRSGTSLVASLLRSAGVEMGQRLMGATPGNPKGHFEDLDFVDFHRGVLRSQDHSGNGFTLADDIRIPAQWRDQARRLVEKRTSVGGLWGWKDPRTTLFLDFWEALVPRGVFVFLYRAPWEVVDSLFRRGDPLFHTNPNLALQLWVRYNRIILDFLDRHPERGILLDIHRVVDDPDSLLRVLRERHGITLHTSESLFDPTLFRRLHCGQRPWLVRHHFPDAAKLYAELCARDSCAQSGAAVEAVQSGARPEETDWAFQDWLDLHKTQNSLSMTRTALLETQSELEMVHQCLQRAQTEHRSPREIARWRPANLNDLDHAILSLREAEDACKSAAPPESMATGNGAVSSTTQRLVHLIVGARQALDLARAHWLEDHAQLAAVRSSVIWKLHAAWMGAWSWLGHWLPIGRNQVGKQRMLPRPTTQMPQIEMCRITEEGASARPASAVQLVGSTDESDEP